MRQTFEDELESGDDRPVDRATGPSLATIWSRRRFLQTTGGFALAATASTSLLALAACDKTPVTLPPFTFKELERGVDEAIHVAEGYDADILIRWGDPVYADAPLFDPMNQTAAAQTRQFGYNNDYVGFVPLPFGDAASDRGVLCVNHEYTNATLMFPDFESTDTASREQIDVTLAAHGGSILEIAREPNGKWKVVQASPYNRRLTMLDTAMDLAGPAAGHERLKTSVDPTGRRVIGTLNNCAGGITPWGTWLMGEENINFYFGGELGDTPERANHERMSIPKNLMGWWRFHMRFDVELEPNEANRFGWITEVDPLDPESIPRKRTALGRFKHEGAESIATRKGSLAVYMGDDQRGEYLYKFVSRDTFDPDNHNGNADLLDNGTLYVARFEDDGSGRWLPLTFGANGLDAANGFLSQADVLIETRRAADTLGATPMDRPEDVQPNAITGRVYVALTNNKDRKADEAHGPNPRSENLWGQIVELIPDNDDHADTGFTWTILVAAGDPANPAVAAQWNASTSMNGWFACPDNLAVDAAGRLWVATDQGDDWAKTSGAADGIFALATHGPERGTAKRFFQVPVGAEMCGPCFTPDATTLFVAVQHPAADIAPEERTPPRPSTFEDPATRWPDFTDAMPPRPSVVAITSHKGGRIGG
mgnify:FL=1